MPLALYSDSFWFPSGVLASAVPARVFPVGSNGLAQLWADAAGTVPLPNPMNTDGSGTLAFYAETGDYWVHIDSESFLVHVGMTQEQADLSTGTASGGRLTVNGSNPTAVDIAPLDGYVVGYTSGSQAAPTITRVKTSATLTVPLDAAGLLRGVTWWLMDASGTVVQQADRPTDAQRRTHLVLGVTGLEAGAITVAQAQPTILPQPANQFADLLDSLRPFNISGNAITANGANLLVNQSAGSIFSRAFNYYTGGVMTNDPHVAPTFAQSPAVFRRITQNTISFAGPPVNTIDPANYDVGGVVTPVPGGSGTATVQRVWISPTGSAASQMTVQYGQTVFATLSAAVSAIGTGVFVPNIVMDNVRAVLVGYIAVTKAAVNLSDPTQAVFTTAPKFAAV